MRFTRQLLASVCSVWLSVGKNKITDRLLQLLRREREYIQLHRDTTVSSLTLSPSLVEGRLVYLDSPLVRAMKFGRVMVIDEVDKVQIPMHISNSESWRAD